MMQPRAMIVAYALLVSLVSIGAGTVLYAMWAGGWWIYSHMRFTP